MGTEPQAAGKVAHNSACTGINGATGMRQKQGSNLKTKMTKIPRSGTSLSAAYYDARQATSCFAFIFILFA